MPLGFLNPWLWAGLAAAAAPIYLHLRRKQTPNLVRFSAGRFLTQERKAQRNPWSIRDWLLLLVRCLGVILIVAAFSWPYWRGGLAGTGKSKLVYILDNTMSRQANGGFMHDRQRLADDLIRQSGGVQVAVIELTSSPRVLCNFGEDPLVAREKVLALQPSSRHGSFVAAFRLASSLLSRSPARLRKIVLLSDNQANQWDESVGTPPFLDNVSVELPPTSARELPNLWVSDLRAQRIYLGDRSKLSLTLQVGHLGPAQRARLTVHNNGRVILERDLDLKDQPRTLVVQTQCDADPAAWLALDAEVHGTPDVLDADNQVFCTVPPIVEGTVALLAQSPYFRVALSPEVMRGHWQARLLAPNELKVEASSKAKAKADVLCLESGFLQDPDARKLLKEYLAAGKGVFLVVNRLSPVIDGCLEELGFEAKGVVNPASGSAFEPVFADRSNFQALQSPDSFKLSGLTINTCAQLNSGTARALVLSPAGQGLFFEETKFKGKLLVCGFGFERDQTSWPIHPTFVPLLDLALQTARPLDEQSNSFAPGDLAILPLPTETSGGELVLRTGGKSLETIPVADGQAQLKIPERPGVYTLARPPGKEVIRMIAVNPPAAESELVFTERPQQPAAWSIPSGGRHPPARSVATMAPVGFSAILRQHLWWWMLVGGLLVLAVETVLAEAKGATS